MPAASITLKNTETGITASTISDENGNYQFLNVRIGSYDVSAELQGFSTAVVKSVGVTVNARQRVDLTLQVSTVNTEVVVTSEAQLLETDSSERGQVIDREQIVNLPLNGRSYSNLALLSTGVVESNQNGVGTSGREGSFNVNGLRNTANSFQLDGVDNNAYGTSNQGFSNQVIQVSPDAVAEFKVQTNNYSAEYGRSGGAVINASYRSGTNEFRGSAWEFNRNTALNATGFFKPTGGAKPSLKRNQFGFVFGGPLMRDRAFFFGDYEGFRQEQRTLVFSTIPTASQRAGILTVPVVNPFTGETYAAGTPIPMTSFARKVLNELPEPNVPGATGNNYQKGVPNADRLRQVQRPPRHEVQRTAVRLRAPRPAEDRVVRSAEHRRPVGQQPERLHQRRFAAVRARRHLHARRAVGPRRAPRHLARPTPARSRRSSADRACASCTASRGCRKTIRRSPAA